MKQIKIDNLMKYPVFDIDSVVEGINIKPIEMRNDNLNGELSNKELNELNKIPVIKEIPLSEEIRVDAEINKPIIENIAKNNKQINNLADFLNEEETNEKIFGKHFQQMTKEERIYLLKIKDNFIRNKSVYFAQHALDRMEERFIKQNDIIRAIKNGQIIEYRENEHDRLIAIRGCTLTRRSENVYVVMSLLTGKVITTYSNKHWTTYTKQYNLEKYVKGFMIKIPDYYKKKIALYY